MEPKSLKASHSLKQISKPNKYNNLHNDGIPEVVNESGPMKYEEFL